jgi:hypothetical protein
MDLSVPQVGQRCGLGKAAVEMHPKGREMIRNLKVLGLALVAAFALTALTASIASAQGKLTSDGLVTLTGSETGSPNPTNPGTPEEFYHNGLTGPFGAVTCNGSTYTGHAVLTHAETTAGKKHALIASGSTTATITPHYATKCFAHIPVLGTRPATVTMNGCDYVFTIGQTTGGTNTYGLSADVKCPAGKVIEVHIYKKDSINHLDNDVICTIKVGEVNNSDITGAHLTNTPASNDIDIVGAAENVHTENTGSVCGNGTSETADLDVDATVKGHSGAGAETAVSITD